MMENSTLRCQTYFLTMPYERRMIQFEVDRFSRACQKIWSHSAKTPKQNVFHSQHLESYTKSPISPRKGKIWRQRILIYLFCSIYVEGKVRLESSGNYVIWIEPRSSLSYHRTIEFGSMEQWRWHDGSMTMTRWYDSAMATVRWHDDADAKVILNEAMLYRAIGIAPSLSRHCTIALSTFLRCF